MSKKEFRVGDRVTHSRSAFKTDIFAAHDPDPKGQGTITEIRANALFPVWVKWDYVDYPSLFTVKEIKHV